MRIRSVPRMPLDWYLDKLRKDEPFTSLLYGDGEFMVAMGHRTGREMQFGEIVTKKLEEEMIHSFKARGSDLIRGTDPNLILWRDYKGGDKDSVQKFGRMLEAFFHNRDGLSFVDGVVWEDAVRVGQLGPLLKLLTRKRVSLICNSRIAKVLTPILKPVFVVEIPERNAYTAIDETERLAIHSAKNHGTGPGCVCIVCSGLSAIPLILRLREKLPELTYLDLGSTFDMFAGIGEQRRWRKELYDNPPELRRIISSNLKEIEDSEHAGQ